MKRSTLTPIGLFALCLAVSRPILRATTGTLIGKLPVPAGGLGSATHCSSGPAPSCIA